MSQYEAGTYVKGDHERVAKNASQAVALTFQGFKLKVEDKTTDEVKPSVVTEAPTFDDDDF